MTNLEKLRTATFEQIRDMFCEDCDKCPSFIFELCDAGKNGFVEWLNEEAKTQKYVHEGWINLKTPRGTICIVASEIVALAPILPDTSVVMNGAITKVFTRGDEDAAWLVCESVDEVMEKIEKAKQEK